MIIKKIFIFTAFFLCASTLFSQEVEWANKVINYSSQMDITVCSAKQILGKPNVLPNGGESPFAWSVALNQNGEEKPGEAYITVSFRKAIKVRQISVAENFNPGSVTKIILISTTNKQIKVYEAVPDTVLLSPRMLNVFIPLTDYEVKSLKLITRPDKVKGVNQIDAIGISSSEDTIQAKINCIEESEFFSEPENLGPNINTPLNETQPTISPDSKTLFFVRENSPDKFGVVNRNIMVSTLNSDNTWSFARNLGGVLSNKGENGYSVMHDGKSLLLGNVYNRDGSVSDGLSISHKDESGWTYPEKITIKNFYTSNPNSTFFMSNDNKILLLSLERKNGYGGLDVYVCFLKDKNAYSEPMNLGPEINTVGDDCSPFLAADNMTLYYSTSGFSGFGSNDIFMTRRLSSDWTKWTEPLNMGPKINTSDWDAYYTIPASGEYAYFVSYKNAIGEGDIFRIELPRVAKPKPIINITGRVTDSLSKKYLSARIIPFMVSENRKLDEALTGKDGEYKLSLPSTYKYEIYVSAEGYIEHKEEIDLSNISDTYEISKDIYLISKSPINKPEVIVENKPEIKIENAKENKPDTLEDKTQQTKNKIDKSKPSKSKLISKKIKKIIQEPIAEKSDTSIAKPESKNLNELFKYEPPKTDKNIITSIFFENNISDLDENSRLLLDTCAANILLYPEGIFEVAGNADPRGSFSYNVRISIERAKKVRDYLISKNCDPKNLLLKGYSNLYPLYPNNSAQSSSFNRRVDIILLKKKRFE